MLQANRLIGFGRHNGFFIDAFPQCVPLVVTVIVWNSSGRMETDLVRNRSRKIIKIRRYTFDCFSRLIERVLRLFRLKEDARQWN